MSTDEARDKARDKDLTRLRQMSRRNGLKRAIGLRQSARIAGVLPHSAELALASLLRDKLVKCEAGYRLDTAYLSGQMSRYRINVPRAATAFLPKDILRFARDATRRRQK